ncbi:hypothetical protein J7I42_28295 [Niastella sp. MAH-29]|uniref:Uncharacterized protein n=1 Tax=Niastella soli TaxID=2821487 RepID=A0ABS3Z4B8_9BACT|nr:hypothetical protein [Niastella soli]
MQLAIEAVREIRKNIS